MLHTIELPSAQDPGGPFTGCHVADSPHRLGEAVLHLHFKAETARKANGLAEAARDTLKPAPDGLPAARAPYERVDLAGTLGLAKVLAERGRAASPPPDSWMLAACEAIALGKPGWDHLPPDWCPALAEVARLRAAYEALLAQSRATSPASGPPAGDAEVRNLLDGAPACPVTPSIEVGDLGGPAVASDDPLSKYVGFQPAEPGADGSAELLLVLDDAREVVRADAGVPEVVPAPHRFPGGITRR